MSIRLRLRLVPMLSAQHLTLLLLAPLLGQQKVLALGLGPQHLQEEQILLNCQISQLPVRLTVQSHMVFEFLRLLRRLLQLALSIFDS